MRKMVAWSRSRRSGQGMTEYIIVVALVAILSIAVIALFGNQIRAMFSQSTSKLVGNTSTETDFSGQASGEVDKGLKDFSK